MNKIRLLALASLLLSLLASANAVTYTANFATDPSLDGWQTFGNTNLFQWNSINQDLEVTWDSTQTNSYFFHPLDFAVTANDDFSVEFDINLSDIASDTEPGKTGPMELGFEFMNLAEATDPNYMRNYGATPNIAAFDYYTDGYFIFDDVYYPSYAASEPAFVSSESDYAPQHVAPYDNHLPISQTAHVCFSYTTSNQTAIVTVTTNGVSLTPLPPLVLNGPNGFKDTNNYAFTVDTFCICNFSSYGDDTDSVLAHGTIAHLVVNVPPPAQNLASSFTNGAWQVQFTDHLGWSYTLQRTTNFNSWESISAAASGNGTNLMLWDSNAPPVGAYYRISAERP